MRTRTTQTTQTTPTLTLRTQEINPVVTGTGTGTGTGTRNTSKNRAKSPSKNGRDKGKGEEPFRFPEDSRREEIDNFAVYVNYIESDNQYVWFAYRSADKEKDSKYRANKGGIALLWGVFLPHCNNVENGDNCSKLPNLSKRKGEYFTGNDLLECQISYYGQVKMLGTCLGTFTKYVGIKTAQSYKLIMTYTPDRDPRQIIAGYLEEKKEDKPTQKIYKPCDSDLCYRINGEILDWAKEGLICDFVLAFTDFLQNDPGAKLKFDLFYEKNLICPPEPEICAPYVGNIKGLNPNKFPKTKEEIYLSHISEEFKKLRRGKNCKILKDTDTSYFSQEEELPQYKPERYVSLEGKEYIEYVPMSAEEFRAIGEKLEKEVSKEQQKIAKTQRKL